MAGEYKFPHCLAAHCAGCRTYSCGELQMQGNLGPNDSCAQCQVDRIDLCHRRGQCVNFTQQQANLFASTQQLVLPPASSPAPSLRPASPLPPGKIETIPRGQEHLYGEKPEEDAQRHQQMLDDSVLARTMTSLEQTHISGQAQQVSEEVQLQVALEEQLVDGAVGGAVDQSAGVAVEQASQVQSDPHLLGTDPVTPQSVRPKLLLTAEQQQARLGARAKTLGAAAISPGDPGLTKVETSLYAPDLSSVMPGLGNPQLVTPPSSGLLPPNPSFRLKGQVTLL